MRLSLLVTALLALAAPALAQERVSFPSNDADLTKGAPTRLDGLLYRPAGEGPHPGMVLLHGCGGLYRGNSGTEPTARHREWAERFAAAGYVTLHVDSFGPRGLRAICRTKGRTIQPGIERARDAYGALLYLQSRPDVRPDRIGLMGWSNGGSTTLWTVALRAKSRPQNLPHGDFAAAVAYYPGCRAPLESKAVWSNRIPLQILVGAADDWTPAAPCEALARREQDRGRPIELVVYPGANHDFDAPDLKVRVLRDIATTASGTATIGTEPAARADAMKRVPEFFARHLAP
jgi:dienelactone hydrolase